MEACPTSVISRETFDTIKEAVLSDNGKLFPEPVQIGVFGTQKIGEIDIYEVVKRSMRHELAFGDRTFAVVVLNGLDVAISVSDTAMKTGEMVLFPRSKVISRDALLNGTEVAPYVGTADNAIPGRQKHIPGLETYGMGCWFFRKLPGFYGVSAALRLTTGNPSVPLDFVIAGDCDDDGVLGVGGSFNFKDDGRYLSDFLKDTAYKSEGLGRGSAQTEGQVHDDDGNIIESYSLSMGYQMTSPFKDRPDICAGAALICVVIDKAPV